MYTPEPFISEASVRDVLDALVRPGKKHQQNSLYYLALVDRLVNAPEFPNIEHQREYALEVLLVEIISAIHSHCRRVHGMPMVDAQQSKTEALEEIAQCAAIDANHFQDWTLLYYLYVRADLDMTSEQLCTVFAVDARTLRRRHNRALHQITNELTRQEWELRSQLWRQHLYNYLPATRPVRLFGREQELEAAYNAFVSSDARHLLITGISGIGKTAFVQELMRKLIDNQLIDRLLWLNEPQSVNFINRYIKGELLADSVSMTVRDYLAQWHTVIVLDGIENILNKESVELVETLVKLDQAVICMTAQVNVPLTAEITHLALGELKPNDAADLAEAIISSRYPADDSLIHLAKSMYAHVGGHPQILQLALYNIDTLDFEKHGLTQVFDRIYTGLTARERNVLLLFALLPPDKNLSFEHVSSLLPPDIDFDAIFSLQRRHLIMGIPSQSVWVESSVRHYVELLYQRNPEVRQIAESLIGSLSEAVSCNVSRNLIVTEYLLTQSWPTVSSRLIHNMVSQFWREVVRQERIAWWIPILERIISHRGDYTVAQNSLFLWIYATFLRRIGEIESAGKILSQVMAMTGNSGNFTQQGWALLDSAVILRHQGRYEAALVHINRAQAIGTNWHDKELADAASIESAQILLDTGKIAEMHLALQNVTKTSRVFLLEIESCLSAGEPDKALSLLLNNFDLLGQGASETVSVHVLLGRCYDQLGRFDEARYHFQTALTLLEKENDLFSLGRIQSNLGTVLIKLGEFSDAYRLLHQAETQQAGIGDRVALAAIRHNLLILNRRTAH
ncbi:MAG: tetratricopeptide repeat protein [Anaerolineaceae bacterium]|nr:tetratricopeptide repeat protein [Anaerolineaceae bacterium]